MGLALQIADSGKGISLPLKFKQIHSGMPISASVNSGGLLPLKIREPVSSREYWKIFSHDMTALSSISYL
jgi:hypothetical protein